MAEQQIDAKHVIESSRLEAFSDGVIAIIITIMVLEIRPPHESTLEALKPTFPVALSYLLSFVFVGIYWNNHHHLIRACNSIDGRVMWTNLHLLFWLSLVPFATAWVGEEHDHAYPAALYGAIAVMAGLAYGLLVQAILRANPDAPIKEAIRRDRKKRISIALYASGVALAFVSPWISYSLYVLVSLLWFIPDRRLERL